MAETRNLYDKEQSSDFYEERYQQGYMDDWPPEKKRRIIEIIRLLGLPERGEALDFGCGNGVLTEVVREALPGWKVYGTDMSTTAVKSAAERYPACTFFESADPRFADRNFDFLFTNHVIEHVYDLEAVMEEIGAFLKPSSSMLHFLPCGNSGSLEHSVCQLRLDGIDPDRGNRFFYEDEGHVRRLTSDNFQDICDSISFELSQSFYSNHHAGAIEWITGSSIAFIRRFTDLRQARDSFARRQLLRLRRKLLSLGMLRAPVRALTKHRTRQCATTTQRILILPAALLYPLSTVVDRGLKRRAEQEWQQRMRDPAGSEMCLYFIRNRQGES